MNNYNKKNLTEARKKPRASVPGGFNHSADQPDQHCAFLFISLSPASSLKVHQKNTAQLFACCVLQLSLICLTILDLSIPRGCVRIDFARQTIAERNRLTQPPPTFLSQDGGTLIALRGVITH